MEIRILGPLEALSADGATIPLGGGKQRALLAALALEAGRTLSMQRLVDDLWGQDPPDTAPKMVQIGVSQLRKVLPPGTLTTRPPGYALEVPPEAVDLLRYEQLVRDGRGRQAAGDAAAAADLLHEAAGLWRGQALAEFAEPFADVEAPRLAELRLAGTEERIDADLALGRHRALVAELELLVARNPLRERLRAQLMLALYRCGRQADALAAYQDARRTLDDELGIEPSATLRDLERGVLQQDPALDPPPVRPELDDRPASPIAPVAATAQIVVGRAPDVQRLKDTLAAALGGRRQIVVVAGEAGAGKTTLVDAFLAAAGEADGALVARGQCVEQHGAAEPYLPMLDALGRLARSQARGELRDVLGDHAPTWLVQLPLLAGPESLAELRDRVVGATPERMLREAVEGLDALAAERPLVLVLEDMHWSDPSTVDLLAALARRDRTARLLVLATLRTADPATAGRPVHAAIAELAARGALQRLDLDVLQVADVERYLELRLPGAQVGGSVAVELAERTGGNPLYVERTVDAWIEEGLVERLGDDRWHVLVAESELARGVPTTVRQFVRGRLLAADPDDRRLLEAASVAGGTFASALVARTCSRDEDVVEQRLDDLARSRVFITPDGVEEWPDGTISARFTFTHDLYREVLYEDLTAGRRARLHGETGTQLEEGHRGATPDLAATLAVHYTRGGLVERALPCIEAAAEHALERLAPREAAELLEGGLELLERLPRGRARDEREFALVTLLGPALLATRSWADERSATVLTGARELARRLGDEDRIERTTYKLATFYEVRGEYARAEGLLRELLARHGALVGDALADTHELMACTLFHQAEFRDALDNADRGIEATSGAQVHPFGAPLGDSADVECHCWAGLSLWFLGQPDAALRRAETAVRKAERAGQRHVTAAAQGLAAVLAQLRQEPERTRELAAGAIEHGARAGYPYRFALGQVLHGWARAMAGDDEGLAELRSGIERSEATGARMDHPYFVGLLAEVHMERGELAAAHAALEQAFAAAPERRYFYDAELHRLQGVLARRRGEPERAEAALWRALELARAQGSPALELRAALSLGELLREDGDADAAASLVRVPYATFVEGFGTADLRAAASFLDAVAAG